MPGKGHRFSEKQDRQAAHVAASERKRGVSPETAKRIGYATVVKQGGGKPKARKGKRKASSDMAMLQERMSR